MQMLLAGGTAGGKRFLKPETLANMTRVHFTYKEKVGFSPGLGMGLGGVIASAGQIADGLATDGQVQCDRLEARRRLEQQRRDVVVMNLDATIWKR